MWFYGNPKTQRVCGQKKKTREKIRHRVKAHQLRRGITFKTRFQRRPSGDPRVPWRPCAKRKGYSTRALSAPAAAKDPDHRPPGAAGFYLDVKDKRHKGKKPSDTRRGAEYRNAPPLYYEPKYKFGQLTTVTYWFFHSFNNRVRDKHEGDWEHIVVRLDRDGDAASVAYFNHLCPPFVYPWGGMSSSVEDDTHPLVYIADAGHGAWRTTGRTYLGSTCPNWKDYKGFFDRRAAGVQWKTWETGLRDASDQSWYGLAVGWGKEGGIGWGPVGPGRFKKGSIPPGW
jgi:hypothetical protein